MRALAIAESRSSQERLCVGLSGFGVAVKVVSTLKEASDELARFWPDAVIVDVPCTRDVAAWIARNVQRSGVRAVITAPQPDVTVRQAIVVPQGTSFSAMAKAIGARAA